MDALSLLVAKKKEKVGTGTDKKAGGWKRKADVEAERKRQYLKDEAEYEKEQEVKRLKKEEERTAANTPIETSYEARMLHWSKITVSADVVRNLDTDDLASMMAGFLNLYDTKLRDAFVKTYKCLTVVLKDEMISGTVLVEGTSNEDDANELHGMIWGRLEKEFRGKLGYKIRLRSFLKLCSGGVAGGKEEKKKVDKTSPEVAQPKKEDGNDKHSASDEANAKREEKIVSTEDGPPREEAYSKEGYVNACVEHYLAVWEVEVSAMSAEEKATREGRKIEARLHQTIEWLIPLQQLLAKEILKKDVLDGLVNIFAAVGKRDYVKANRMYLEQLAIGKAPWPMGATMVGIHARAAREKISEDKIAHVMNDEQTRKYIQSVKRLITVAERHYPAGELA